MLLLVGGILSIENEDPLNLFLSESTELVLFLIMGLVLISSPFWLVPHLQRTIKKSNMMKVEVSHHSRNKAQAILGTLDLLEASATTKEQLLLIQNMRDYWIELIDSLSKVVENNGEAIDYPAAIKEYSKSQKIESRSFNYPAEKS